MAGNGARRRGGAAATGDPARDLREARREISRLSREHAQVLDDLSSSLVTFDGRGGLLSVNALARQVLHAREPAPRGHLRDLFGREFAEALLERLERGRGGALRREGRAVLADGEEKVLGYSVTRLHRPGGVAWILIFRDLTEAKRVEVEMRRLDRLVSLGEISANVAHELKNPLTVMYANMEWLLERVPPEFHERIQIVIDHMERMEQIIGRMGLLSKEAPVARRAVDLNELVQQMLVFLDKTLREHRIEVRRALPGSPLWMEADPSQIQQVLLNLCINAIQAMGRGGVMTVRLERRRDGAGPCLALRIADSGPGIHPLALKRIFEPFFTTKDAGTGLGLSITRQIVAAHGGKIRACNRRGGGAAFSLTFPAATVPAA